MYGTIILIVVLVVFLVGSMYFSSQRNKKEMEKQQQLVSSLKKGDFVLTYSGIFGKISEIVEKEAGKFLVIETGEKNKNFVTVSENAIYMQTNNNPKIYDIDGKEKQIIEKIEEEPEAKDSSVESVKKTRSSKTERASTSKKSSTKKSQKDVE